MTTWSWKDLDYSKAKAGDIVVDGGQVEYIVDIRPRGTKTNQVSPELRVTIGGYQHNFHWENDPGAGYGFDCFADGTLPERKMFTGQTAQQYFDEIKATEGLIYDGMNYDERSFNEPATIRCECGEIVSLDHVMTNTCDKCHRDYNISGQLLAPRNQWGWDTGESLDEILNSDWGINESVPSDWE